MEQKKKFQGIPNKSNKVFGKSKKSNKDLMSTAQEQAIEEKAASYVDEYFSNPNNRYSYNVKKQISK